MQNPLEKCMWCSLSFPLWVWECGLENRVCDVLSFTCCIVPPLIQGGRARQALQGTQLLLSVNDPLTDWFIHLSFTLFGECLDIRVSPWCHAKFWGYLSIPKRQSICPYRTYISWGTQIIDRDIKYNVLLFFGGWGRKWSRVLGWKFDWADILEKEVREGLFRREGFEERAEYWKGGNH